METTRRIRATHKYTGEVLNLFYPSIAEAKKRNPGLKDFEYIGLR